MKNFRQQQHRPKKNTLVIGLDAVTSALQTGQQLDRIYLDTKIVGQDAAEVKRLAAENIISYLKSGTIPHCVNPSVLT